MPKDLIRVFIKKYSESMYTDSHGHKTLKLDKNMIHNVERLAVVEYLEPNDLKNKLDEFVKNEVNSICFTENAYIDYNYELVPTI